MSDTKLAPVSFSLKRQSFNISALAGKSTTSMQDDGSFFHFSAVWLFLWMRGVVIDGF
jgi:hypothetical protein